MAASRGHVAPTPFPLMLFLLFLGLELGHVIDWPWYWVAAPIWGWLLLMLIVAAARS